MSVKNCDNHIEFSSTEDAKEVKPQETSDHSARSCCETSGNLLERPGHKTVQVDRPEKFVIEKTLSGHTGVIKAGVNFARQEAEVNFNPAEVNPDDLKSVVEAVGYRLLEGHGDVPEKAKGSFRRLADLRPYLIGAAAAIGVVGFYLGLLTLTSDWYNARLEFREYWLWILALAAGLGVQATLFSLLRAWHQGRSMKAAKVSLAASGGMSTTAMAACCAHYLAVLLPALGLPFLSAAAAGLARYQTYFFLAGVLSNLFGIGLMLRMMAMSGMIQIGALVNHLTFGLQHIRR